MQSDSDLENIPDIEDIEDSETEIESEIESETEDSEAHYSETETDTDNDDSEIEYGVMHYCLSCQAYYDGHAQCCFDMHHVIYKVNMKTREVIEELC